MSTHKYIERICAVAAVITVILAILFMNAERFGIQPASQSKEYEDSLFDTSYVHTIDIQMDDWDSFLDTCTSEEYSICSLTIDGETISNVAIRGKGNTSLTQVATYGNDRYSFKIEFDHYDDSINYQGLDRLCLNNVIQDNTYMKDYLTYQMMDDFGVDAPLSSFAYITVNGEDWGLYIAVEDVTDSFLERNYGNDHGELYKPDSTGNRGGGEMPDFENLGEGNFPEMPDGNMKAVEMSEDAGDIPGTSSDQGETVLTDNGFEFPINAGGRGGMGGGMGGSMGSSDTLLVYTDDDYDSYSNIFDNAKTDITDADKDRLIESLKQLNEGENIDEVVNVDEVIRYFVVHNFVCNFDSYTGTMIHNYYLYEEDGQLSMIPWDYNLAFGGFQGASDATDLVNYPIDTPVSGSSVEERPMLAWIFSNEEYTELYHTYFAEFISEYFDSGYFSQMMDEVYKLISPYVEKDPTKFCTYEEFETGFATLKEFCLLRAESITGQLNGTIPATSEGQAEDSSSLIDASHINISDMGSMMNGGMGRGGMGGGGRSVNFTSETTADTADAQGDISAVDVPQVFPEAGGAAAFGMGDIDTDDVSSVNSENTSEDVSVDTGGPGENTDTQGDAPQSPDTGGRRTQGSETDMSSESPESSGDASDMPEESDRFSAADTARDMKSQNSGQNISQSDNSTPILLVASLIVLAAGLIIAGIYKKRC